jgi:hypothetical protein
MVEPVSDCMLYSSRDITESIISELKIHKIKLEKNSVANEKKTVINLIPLVSPISKTLNLNPHRSQSKRKSKLITNCPNEPAKNDEANKVGSKSFK